MSKVREIIIKKASFAGEGGETRLIYNNMMSVSAAQKHGSKLNAMARYLPEFPKSSGFWLYRFPWDKSMDQPAPIMEDSSTSKRKRTDEEVVEPKKNVGPLKAKRIATQGFAMTEFMAECLFTKPRFARKVCKTINSVEREQAEDVLADKIVVREQFVEAGTIRTINNRREVKLHIGVVITNYSHVKERAVEEASNWESGPVLLAQLVVRIPDEEQDFEVLEIFTVPATEMMLILRSKSLIKLVAECCDVEVDIDAGATTEDDDDDDDADDDDQDA